MAMGEIPQPRPLVAPPPILIPTRQIKPLDEAHPRRRVCNPCVIAHRKSGNYTEGQARSRPEKPALMS
jgi:hypothetical protein